MATVEDVMTPEVFGHLVKTKSKRFGTHWYMFIKDNGKYWGDVARFVQLPKGNVLDWCSMKDDEVLAIKQIQV